MSSHTWFHIISVVLDVILFLALSVCVATIVAMAKKHYDLMQAQERANESFTKNISLQSSALGNIAEKLEKLELKTKGLHPSRFESVIDITKRETTQ